MDYDGRKLFDGEREVYLSALSFGNARSTDFRAIWNSRDYRLFRRRNKTGDFPGPCRTCFEIRDATARKVVQIVGRRPHL
jgi:hypothetical protein